MKISIIYILLLINLTLNAQGTPEQSEKLRFEAQLARDTIMLQKLLSEDLVYVHSNALLENKSDFMRSVAGGGIEYLELRKLSGDPVRRWGRTAGVNGVVAVRGNFRQAPFEVELRYTSLYRRQGGIWKLVSWQSTRIP